MPLGRRHIASSSTRGTVPRRRRRAGRRPHRRGRRAFCAGGDLKAAFAGELAVDASPADGVLGPSRWTDVYKPTIAAVNGVAYAGGLEWACWTDLAIADEHATFGVTCRRWNIGLADGGTQRLTRILGYRRAIELIITGRVIDAREAERIGLVNQSCPAGRVCGVRSNSPRPSPRSPSPHCAPTSRRLAAGRADPSTTACRSRPSASAGRSLRRKPPRGCADSTNAITLIDGRTPRR